MKVRWIWIFVVLPVAGACGAPAGGAPDKKSPPAGSATPGALAIRVGAIEARDLEQTLEISGSLASPDDSTMGAEVEGKIMGIKFDLGDRVQKNEVMARINPDEFRFKMDQAEAQKVQAEANFKRVETLAQKEMVAPRELDDARSVAQQARAAADLARKKFADTEVRAPFSGAVARRVVSPGEYVKVGQPLFEIVVLDPLKLTGDVSERYLPLVHIGDELEAHVDAFAGQTFAGRVSRIGAAVNPQSRSFPVEARIGNPKGLLKPGLFAKVHLHRAAAERTLVVPEAALTSFAGVTKVFVIEAGMAHEHPVELGEHLADGFVAVRGAGLTAGQQVAVAGVGRLADGVSVTIAPQPPAPEARSQGQSPAAPTSP